MFWKKINRGVAVTAVLIIGVIIYLVALEAVRAADKPNIEKTCRSYIEDVINSYMLPVQYRSGETKISDSELNDYVASAKENIKKHCIEGNIMQADNCEGFLRDQAGSGVIIETLEKEFVRIESLNYNKNTVEVRLNYRTRFRMSGSEKDELATTSETVFLQKIDNEWKVTYSTINFDFYYNYFYEKTEGAF